MRRIFKDGRGLVRSAGGGPAGGPSADGGERPGGVAGAAGVTGVTGVTGIVLAAGSSSRLGRNKLLVEVEGEALVRRTVRRTIAAGLDPVLVVVGFEADRVVAALADLPCRPVVNGEFAGGQATSFAAGIAAVPDQAAAAVVVLADMPRVTADMIAALVERHRETAALVVSSDYGGVPAPPTLYDRALFAELAAAAGPECARRAIARHPDRALTVSWPAAALGDLDVETDFEQLRTATAAPP